jgi:hypothetical protein
VWRGGGEALPQSPPTLLRAARLFSVAQLLSQLKPVDFRGLVPFLGAILGPNLGCGRSLSIVIAKVDCPIDKLFAAAEALISTPLDARGRFKRRLALVAFSGTTTPKKVSVERLHIDL